MKCFEVFKGWLKGNFVPVIGAASSLVMLVLYMWIEKQMFVIDRYSLVLFFSIFLFPATIYLDKIKVGSIELVRRQEIIEKRSLLGEAVTIDGSVLYYVHSNGEYYKLPDKETADFFSSSKGIIRITENDLKLFTFHGNIDSVKRGRIIQAGNHIFIDLNHKLRHIGSAKWLMIWQRENDVEVLPSSDISNREYW